MPQSKQRRNPKQGARSLSSVLLPGSGRPSDPSQIIQTVKLSGPPTLIFSQTTTGLASQAYVAASLSALANAASWKAIYDEYRIIAVEYHIRAVGQQSGVTKFVIDDEDTTTPNAAWIGARRGRVLSNNSLAPMSTAVMKYRSQDESDLKWLSCIGSPSVLTQALKLYTDATVFGTGTTSTNLFYIDWLATFQFRGIGASA